MSKSEIGEEPFRRLTPDEVKALVDRAKSSLRKVEEEGRKGGRQSEEPGLTEEARQFVIDF